MNRREIATWKKVEISEAVNSFISIYLFSGHITETRTYEEI